MEEEKYFKVECPEGYEIDKENSTLERICFKKIEQEVRTWEDLIGKYVPRGSAYIEDFQIGEINRYWAFGSNEKNLFIDSKHAKSALAMAQISQLLPYFGGIITDEEWKDDDIYKYTIERYRGEAYCDYSTRIYHFLAFNTEEQRDNFLKYNERLVKDYLMID